MVQIQLEAGADPQVDLPVGGGRCFASPGVTLPKGLGLRSPWTAEVREGRHHEPELVPSKWLLSASPSLVSRGGE